MPGKYRKAFIFNFNYRVWMNIFCHRVYCMLHMCAGKQTILWDLRHRRNINNMIHATYITHMSSEKEATLGLPQLGLTFLADSNSWNAS